MKTLNRILYGVRSLLHRRRVNAELDEELAFHVDQQAAQFEREGMSAADARARAQNLFGNTVRHREASRDVRATAWIDDAATDTRFALRLVRRQPGFSANVILIAALGIAVCTTTFSVVSGILLSPLPFSGADRIFNVQSESSDGTASGVIPVDAYHRLEHGPLVEAVGTVNPSGWAIEWNGDPERIRGALATPSIFDVYGFAPVLGRRFTQDDADKAAPVALVAYESWRTRFGGDSAVIGRQLTLDGQPYTIIGVMPKQFRADLNGSPELWLPLRVGATVEGRTSVTPTIRLRDGVSSQAAEAWIASATGWKVLAKNRVDSVAARPVLYPIREFIVGEVDGPLRVLLGAVILVLVLVGANIATMFLARSSGRDRELGVRRALGASASRQFRQLIVESSVLTSIGGAIGIALSLWAIVAVRGLGTRVLQRMDAVSVDWRVLAFAVGGTLITGIVGGIAPALVMGTRRAANLRDAGDTRVTRQRTSSILVIAQITLSVVLLVGAGLLVKGFLRVAPTDPGFALTNRAALAVSMRGLPSFPATDPLSHLRFAYAVRDRMMRVSDVREVAITNFMPFSGSVNSSDIDIVGGPAVQRPRTATQNSVSTNYFSVMEIAILQGRGFTDADRAGAERVVVVNETAAKRWWPNASAIGQYISVGKDTAQFTARVVGIARDGRTTGNDTRMRTEIFFPLEQRPWRFFTFVAHTAHDPRPVMHDLQRAIWSVAPRLPIGSTTDMATLAAESVRRARFYSWAMGSFAGMAALLSAFAVHGLLSFAVAQRRREIGVRMALGATQAHIGSIVIRRALTLGVTGVVVGIVMARALTHYLESLLTEVSATDATVFAGTAVAGLLIAIAAACVPMYQAVRTDPIKSLRA